MTVVGCGHFGGRCFIPIAMWSGPRNLSTALMRSFENRPDSSVWDEPFYAPYLLHRGADHPLRSEIIEAEISDWRGVVARLLSPPADGARIFYQKHMTHHMLADFDRGWIKQVRNAFLIRDPIAVIMSYHRKRENPSFADLGFTEQAELFSIISDHLGVCPPIIDAGDLVCDPRSLLRCLCFALGIDGGDEILAKMLCWPRGRRASDGIWGTHWYGSVWRSTGFEPAKRPSVSIEDLPSSLRLLAERALPYYTHLHAHRLRPV